MRRTHTETETHTITINLTPLIDMVFILLIFFIVTASFVKETGVEIQRPSAQTATRQELGNILVAVNDKQQIWLDKQQVDIRALRTQIEHMRAEIPTGEVIVVADAEVPTRLLIQVMDQIRLAGVNHVAIAATQP